MGERGAGSGEDALGAGLPEAVGQQVGDGDQDASLASTGAMRSSAFLRLASELA